MFAFILLDKCFKAQLQFLFALGHGTVCFEAKLRRDLFLRQSLFGEQKDLTVNILKRFSEGIAQFNI